MAVRSHAVAACVGNRVKIDEGDKRFFAEAAISTR